MSARAAVPRAPPQRLASVRSVTESRNTSKAQQPMTKSQKRNICTNKDCDCFGKESKDAFHNEGELICGECGTVIDSSNIVSDVTFAENTSGQAVVQGGHIGENQRTAKTWGANAPRGIGGQSDSREQTIKAGTAEIKRLVNDLPIVQKVGIAERAELLYRLASTHQFTQGRDTRVVAAVAVYYCCRESGYQQAPVMLMDLAERISVNVYRLGDTYKDFRKKLFLDDNNPEEAGPAGRAKPIQPISSIEIESMVERFCQKLEFGEHYRAVASDACALVARMDRDWMVTGRRPAGICGACIILAARMHNYRRSVREIVYVVSVADATIKQRLDEFRHTLASRMTVKQFRDEGGKHHKYEHDPPSLRKTKEKQKKHSEKLRTRDIQRNSQIPEEIESRQASTAPEASNDQEVRRDAEGFVIPPLPIDPDIVRDSELTGLDVAADLGLAPTPPKKQGKKRKREAEAQPAVKLSRTDIVAERGLTKEIEKILHDRINMTEFSFESAQKRAEVQAEEERNKWRQAQTDAGRPYYLRPGQIDYTSELIDPSEFADDPEVMQCELSEQERAIKEKIWLTQNEDWLRAQQRKTLTRSLEEARNGGVKKKEGRKGAKGRIGRPGDLSYQSHLPRASTPAQAMQRMMSRRGKTAFSKKVDYIEFNRLYGTLSSTSSEDGRSTREGSTVSILSEPDPVEASSSKRPKSGQSSSMRAHLPTPSATQPRPGRSGVQRTRSSQKEVVDISEEEDSEEEGVRQALGDTLGTIEALGIAMPKAKAPEKPTTPDEVEVISTDAVAAGETVDAEISEEEDDDDDEEVMPDDDMGVDENNYYDEADEEF